MKAKSLLALIAALVTTSALPAMAKNAGPPSVAHLPLWTVKGRPTTQFAPGLTATLLLTPEQQEQLARAWQETSGSEAVAAAARTLKRDPHASEEAKQAARAVIEAAVAHLQQRIDAILSADQKALIQWINGIYTEVGKTVWAAMEAEYAAAKGNKEATERLEQQRREKLKATFLQKLKEILTPEQWAAMMAAAEVEKGSGKGGNKGKGEEIRLKPSTSEPRGKGEKEVQLTPPAP